MLVQIELLRCIISYEELSKRLGDVTERCAERYITGKTHLRKDEFEKIAKDLHKWLADTGAKTLYIEPGSPWENGHCESFNSKLRDEFLTGDLLLGQRPACAG